MKDKLFLFTALDNKHSFQSNISLPFVLPFKFLAWSMPMKSQGLVCFLSFLTFELSVAKISIYQQYRQKLFSPSIMLLSREVDKIFKQGKIHMRSGKDHFAE